MEVKVYPANVKRTAEELVGIGSAVRTSSAALRNVAASLAKDKDLYAAISSRISRYGDELEEYAGRIEGYGSGAAVIAALYEDADNSLAGISGDNTAGASGSGGDGFSGGGGGGGGVGGRKISEDSLAWKYGSIVGGAGVFCGSLEGGILVTEGKLKVITKIDLEKGEAKAGLEASAKVAALKGRAEGQAGIVKGGVEGSVGQVGAKGRIGLTLMEDGKPAPGLFAEASAEAIGLEGKVDGQIGSDEYNIHGSAKGDLGYASAKAGVEIGKEGFKAEAGAEAYAAKGEIKGGFTLFGIKVDASVEGKAGGAGIGASADVGTTSASGYIGAGLVLGAGIKINIDWSEFKLF